VNDKSVDFYKESTMIKLFLTAITVMVFSQFSQANCNNLLDYETRKLRSQETVNLCDAYQGKVILMVNTASQCGYTPQFKGLEVLYQRYKDQGLVVVGFPSNDFNQEHAEEEKTASVCYINYGVTFQMLSTSSVKGDQANPVFMALAEQTGTAPRWNFTKYLVDKKGQAIKVYSSSEQPVGGDLEEAIKAALEV
jgi:glutathione peroxidase